MSITTTYQQSAQVGGKSFSGQRTISSEGVVLREVSLAAAKTGTLTVRTDANTGSLTMTSGAHGILTADKIGLYWDGGSRRNVTVGSVSGSVVPIDLGSGDDLPTAATAITAQVELDYDFRVDGSEVDALLAYSEAPANVSFRDDTDAELYNIQITAAAGGPSLWDQDNPEGTANPLTGVTVDHITVSQGSSSAAKTLRVAAPFT